MVNSNLLLPVSKVHVLSTWLYCLRDFLCGSTGKESTCNAGDLGSIPRLGRSPGERKGYPLQYCGLEKSMDCIVHGVPKTQTWLSDFHFTSYCLWSKSLSADPSPVYAQEAFEELLKTMTPWVPHSHSLHPHPHHTHTKDQLNQNLWDWDLGLGAS